MVAVDHLVSPPFSVPSIVFSVSSPSLDSLSPTEVFLLVRRLISLSLLLCSPVLLPLPSLANLRASRSCSRGWKPASESGTVTQRLDSRYSGYREFEARARSHWYSPHGTSIRGILRGLRGVEFSLTFSRRIVTSRFHGIFGRYRCPDGQVQWRIGVYPRVDAGKLWLFNGAIKCFLRF